tara:strand:+ start:1405 stop:1611 length:207 start_codon:yes stop_codon:yes gene_type:complete
MTESKVSTTIVLNGGIVETWKINGFFYAKAIVNGVITFSDAVSKWHCEQFVFEAEYYGTIDFSRPYHI